jgi:hypothetical protein
VRTLIILWDCLFAFGGWYLYRHPRLLEKDKCEPRQVTINKVGGLAVMILGAGCAVVSVLQVLVKTQK